MFNHENIMNKYNLAENIHLECLCPCLSAIYSVLDERCGILFLSFKKDGGDSKKILSNELNINGRVASHS
jgi:hypothetical protein